MKVLKVTTVIISLLICGSMVNALEYQSYGEFTRTQLSQVIEVVQKALGSN
jgi:hypothetical protein